MSSLRAVSAAANLHTKGWSRLLPIALRNGNVPSSSRPALNITSFPGAGFFQFRHKTNDVESNKRGQKTKANDTSSSSLQLESSKADNFDELINASRRIFSPSFGQDCKYRLITWQKMANDVERSGKPVNLKKIVSETFPDVLEFSLTPVAPPDIRISVLKLLLTQPSDDKHMERLLQSTAADVMQLPIGVVAEIVRLLATAPATELRLETRSSLVAAVVNRRWYEVGPKHLVFFMFQMDQLFPVSAISQEQRRKSRPNEKQSRKGKNRSSSKNLKSKQQETHSDNVAGNDNIVYTSGDGTESLESVGSEAVSLLIDELEEDSALPQVAILNLESRAITLADELKVKDLARVVSLLSRWGNRNEPLLSACLHRLSLADLNTFTLAQLFNLLQGMATLRLHNPQLLQNISRQICQDGFESSPSPSQVCALLSSLSFLLWTGANDDEPSEGREDLVSSCLLYLAKYDGKDVPITKKESTGVLTSLANLAATPITDDERRAVRDMASYALSGKCEWWRQIQCAWCLAVLQCLDAQVASTVLESRFVEQVVQKVSDTGATSLDLISATKLAQINMAARLEVEGFCGPHLSDEQLNLCSQQAEPTADQKAAKTVLANTLRKFVDLLTYVDLNPTLPKGVNADALMCANSEGEVRPLASGTQDGDRSKTEITHMLAIQYLPFSKVTSPHQTPTGPSQMAARHLSLQGYIPVQILYSDLKPSLSILERVSNLKARIKKAVERAATDNIITRTTTSSSTVSATSASSVSDSAPKTDSVPKPS